MELNELYRAILSTANMTEVDGCVSLTMRDESKPVIIKGKRLVLPTQEHLSNADWSGRVVFHPLSEHILRNEESAVLAEYRKNLNIRLNYVMASLMAELLTIATSGDIHKRLTQEQADFLPLVKDADEKTLQNFMKVIGAMKTDQTNRMLVSIFLKKSGLLKGNKYARVGVVSFPFYNELKQAKSTEIYGVKLRIKDVQVLLALMEYMLPGIEEPESFNRGSRSPIAPSMDALMHSVMALIGPFNELTELFRNVMDNPDELKFEDVWAPIFDNLTVMENKIRMVPMQPGNDGDIVPAPMAPVAPAAPAPVAPPPVAAPPQWQPGQPMQPAHNPYYNPAPPPPPPPVVDTGHGVSMDAVLANNPALAAYMPRTPAYGAPGAWQAPQQQRIPGWAVPDAYPTNPYGQPQQQQGGVPAWVQQQRGQAPAVYGQPQQQQYYNPAPPGYNRSGY
jgi:hypothetical protein